MRGSPGEGEWFLMRFWRTVVGVVFGVLLGIVVTSPLTWIPVLKNALNPEFLPNRVSPVMGYIVQNWSLDGLQDWDTVFWTIILMPIAGGAVGLWLDTRAERKWRNLERPEDQQADAPSKRTGRNPRQWARFRVPQDQQGPKR